jgi:hypothetical protein
MQYIAINSVPEECDETYPDPDPGGIMVNGKDQEIISYKPGYQRKNEGTRFSEFKVDL